MQYLKYLLSKIYQRSKRTRAGFTLVEGIFSSVIGSMVLGMTMILYVEVNNNMTLGVASAEINADGRLAMDRIVRDVRSAIQLEATPRSINGTNYATGDDELIIKIYSIDSTGNIIPSTYDYVVYALDSSESTQLRKIVDPDSTSNRNSLNQVIVKNINSFSLSSNGTPLSSVGSLSSVTALEIALTVNKTPLQNKTVTQTINSEAELRND